MVQKRIIDFLPGSEKTCSDLTLCRVSQPFSRYFGDPLPLAKAIFGEEAC